ncbi:alcohol oxidase, partial [Ramicandelaber brevisporus]
AFTHVIIGAGTAGAILANRISSNPENSVVVVEAGGSYESNKLAEIPAGFPALWRNEKYSWQLHTTSQEKLNGRQLFWPRGKGLGGSSSINAAFHQRPPAGDIDAWEREHGCTGWNWRTLQPYFDKYDSSAGGPLETTTAENGAAPVSRNFADACTSIGIHRLDNINDTANGLNGVGFTHRFIDSNGRRASTATGYLSSGLLAERPNLSVVTNCIVTRILFNEEGDTPEAVGIELASLQHGKVYHIFAKSEVILCAGAVHSPQLLMVSGVGPREHLETHGIRVVADLPGVGANLQDHPGVNLSFTTPFWDSRSYLKYLGIFALAQWMWNGSGPAASNGLEAAVFVNTEETSPPADRPDIEISSIFAYVGGLGDSTGPPLLTTGLATMFIRLMRPHTSSGFIKLASSCMLDAPAIDPDYFADDRDMDAMVRGVRLALQINKAMVERGTSYGMYDLNKPEVSDQDIVNYLKERCETGCHPTSTCSMGNGSNRMAVVDTNLCVNKVAKLRTVDASVFPSIPSVPLVATVIALAERAADVI